MKKIKNFIWKSIIYLINLLNGDGSEYTIIKVEKDEIPINPTNLMDKLREKSEESKEERIKQSEEIDDKLVDYMSDKSERILEIIKVNGTREVEDEESIKEHIIKSAKMLNEYREMRNRIIGFKSPSDELKKLMEERNYKDMKLFKSIDSAEYRDSSEAYQRYLNEILNKSDDKPSKKFENDVELDKELFEKSKNIMDILKKE